MLKPLQPRQYYLDVFGSEDLLELVMRDDDVINQYRLKHQYHREFGFALLTLETITALAAFFGQKKVIDAGSGTGYLSDALHEAGVDITAVDDDSERYGFRSLYRRDKTIDVRTLLPGDYDAILLVWPAYDSPFGYDVISSMRPGQILVFQGEGCGGCTADAAFYEELSRPHWVRLSSISKTLNEGHICFPGIRDSWQAYKRAA